MLDWGTVPAFGSIVVAVWALAEARLVRRRQKVDDLQAHAKNIVVSPSTITDLEEGSCLVETQVTNYSEYDVRDVWLHVHSKRIAEPVVKFIRSLPAKQTLTVREVCASVSDPFPFSMNDRLQVNASFVDVNGYKWQRWANGEIRPPIDLRLSRNAILRLIVRMPMIGKLVGRWKRRRNRPAIRDRHDS
jgi:hypothetical protein